MKSLKNIVLLILFWLIAAPTMAQFQYARRVVPLPALPAVCIAGSGDVVVNTAAGLQGLYQCSSAGVYIPVGLTGAGTGGFNFAQGAIIASSPFINHTATWNAGAVTFSNIVSNITDTASAGASTLIDLQVGGANRFSVSKDGTATFAGGVTIGAVNQLVWTGRGIIASPADGRFSLVNNAAAEFNRLTLGPEAITHAALIQETVAGQTQGITIVRGDGTVQTFAGLGAAANGSMIYCSDCTVASPCAAAGTGAIAKRLNGAWVCN